MAFQAQTTADLATVTDRLAAVEQELQVAEATAPAAALRKALGSATDEDAALIARLPLLRQEADSLRMAKEAAEQADADRIATGRRKEMAAQIRACTQHVARTEKEVLACAAALDATTRCFNRALEAGRAATALLPSAIRAKHWPAEAMALKRVKQMLTAEMMRLGRANGEGLAAPNASAMNFADGRGGITPLAVTLGRDMGAVRAELRTLLQKIAPAEIEDAAA